MSGRVRPRPASGARESAGSASSGQGTLEAVVERRQGNDDQFSTTVAFHDHSSFFKPRRQTAAEATDIFARR
jgi:hypothetical protein